MFNKCIIAFVLAIPFLSQYALAADCSRTYTIKEGDTCDKISAENNVSTYQLGLLNDNIIDPDCKNLHHGDDICIGTLGEDCETTYVVGLGDTCLGIQEAWGINSTILYANNPQINEECDNIYVGEVLCTSETVQVPVAPEDYIPPAATIPATAVAAHVATPTPTVTPSSSPSAVQAAQGFAATPAPGAHAAAQSADGYKTDNNSEDEEWTVVEDDGDESVPWCEDVMQ